jgi:polynucleotide 5'-hydroxyl-kinase GRC3/NOL9
VTNTPSQIDIPPAWEQITLSKLSGLVLVAGAPDTGKSTFARYLYRRLCSNHQRVAFIDGDIGQASLGPPTTMTLALSRPGDDSFPPAGPRFRSFVGSVSPRRHMLPMLVGAHRLVRKAEEASAGAIVFDTTGLVDPAYGGGELKRAKVELLRPSAIVGIQRRNELEHLLIPLRCSQRTRVIDLPASRAARRREITARRQCRADRFRDYFDGAVELEVAWRRLAVFPAPTFVPHHLIALEDSKGFTLGLGIVVASDSHDGTVTLHTPLTLLVSVDAVRLGSMTLDPHSFRETRL